MNRDNILESFFAGLRIEKQAPSLEFLTELVGAHLEIVPFESASKVLRVNSNDIRLVTLQEYVEDFLEFGLGGTCFANNGYFVELLRFLGFDAELNSVIGNDINDSHVSCKVKLDGLSFLVDLGTMSHFSGPLLLESGKIVEDRRGDNRVVFIPGENETYRLEFYRNGRQTRKHVSKNLPKSITEFSNQIRRTLEPDAYWMQILCICKHIGDTTYGVWNKTFYKQCGLKVEKQELTSIHDLKEVLTNELQLPNAPIEDVLDKMGSYSKVTLY